MREKNLEQIDGAGQIQGILNVVSEWARREKRVLGVALVGSWARGEARPDSDIDLVLLVDDWDSFRTTAWMAELDWDSIGEKVVRFEDADYGLVWSRFLFTDKNQEIEFGFAHIDWLKTDPVDAGTKKVVSDGMRILLDKQGRLGHLLDHVRQIP